MKRCPECLFLYPDSDERCDFDKTLLEVVDDAEIEAATRPSKSSKRPRRVLPIVVAAVGLLLGVIMFAIYYAVSHQTQNAAAAPQTSSTPVPVGTPQPATPEPSPSPTVSPSPSPSPKAPVNGTPSAAHTRASADPVSTSGPGIGNRQGAKPVIMLTSGGKIEADEVWRTKDGVWYRRNGLVTLLKRGQVKAIVTR